MARRRRTPHRNATRNVDASRNRHAGRGEPVSRAHAADEFGDQALLRDLRSALRAGDGLGLVDLISGIAEVANSEELLSRVDAEPGSVVGLRMVIDWLLEVDVAETTAALHVLVVLAQDELTRERIRRELAARRQPMPEAVESLARARVTGGYRIVSESPDVDVILLRIEGWVMPTWLVQVDRRIPAVTDAYYSDLTVEEVFQRSVELFGAQAAVEEWTLAGARARIEQAIETGEMLLEPIESETWPVMRPLLRALVSALPDGDPGYYPEDTEQAQAEAVAAIVRSEEYRRAGFSTEPGSDDADIVDTLVWITGFMGVWAPLDWTVQRVEWALLDLVPRKVHADRAYLARIPDVLTVMVQVGGHLTGKPQPMVRQAVAAVEDCREEYLGMIRGDAPNRGGQASHLAVRALEMMSRPQADRESDISAAALRMCRLTAVMGGEDALAALDPESIEPLAERPLDLSDVAESVRAVALQVDKLAADAIDALFGDGYAQVENAEQQGQLLGLVSGSGGATVDEPSAAQIRAEFRAAVRVLIERVARLAPDSLARGKPANTAAALCWAVGRANDLVGEENRADVYFHVASIGPVAAQELAPVRGVQVRELYSHLGVNSNVTQRAGDLMKRIGLSPQWVWAQYALGDPALLTSHKRRLVAAERDWWAPAAG